MEVFNAENVDRDDENENLPVSWYSQPYDTRYHIIKQLDVETKMTYYISSDITSMDMPKNYIKNIQLYPDRMKIKTKDDQMSHFSLIFSIDPTQTEVRLVRKKQEWSCLENDSPAVVLARYFRRLTRKSFYLKTLIIDAKVFPIRTTSIQHLRNLTYLTINFTEHGLMDCGFTNFEQLYKIRDVLTIKYIKLDLSNLTQFTAQFVTFGKAIISTEDINQYLKRFVDGHVQGRTREVLMAIDASSRLQEQKVIEGLPTLGLEKGRSVNEKTTFAMVSSKDSSKLAVVAFNQEYFNIEYLSEKELRADELFAEKYGELLDEYKNNLPNSKDS